MYINKIDALNVPFTFQTAHATAEEKALLDSGATENFLDEETWRRMGVGRRLLDKPLKVINVDRTENRKGTITHYCRLRILYNGESDLQDFYIASLGRDRMILGYPFFRRFEPKVLWKQGTLQDGSIIIQSAVFKHLDKVIEHYQLRAKKARKFTCLGQGRRPWLNKWPKTIEGKARRKKTRFRKNFNVLRKSSRKK